MKDQIIRVVNSNNGRIVIALIVGIAIGAIFYPSKTIETTERQRYEERIQKEVDYSRQLQQDHQEKVLAIQGESLQQQEQLNAKIQKQKTEISSLKSRVSERTFKLVKPDGTIEERSFRESELSKDTTIVTTIRAEYDRKIKQTEERYKKVYAERLQSLVENVKKKTKEQEEKIAELERTKKVEINKSNTRLGVGVTTDQGYYGLVERDIFGPVFIHGIFQVNPDINDQSGGLGIGIKF